MVITIWVDNLNPVEGRAAGADQPPRPFVGWLQLLSVLADLMEPQQGLDAPPGGLGGQPDP
jgi:hypothetical protein